MKKRVFSAALLVALTVLLAASASAIQLTYKGSVNNVANSAGYLVSPYMIEVKDGSIVYPAVPMICDDYAETIPSGPWEAAKLDGTQWASARFGSALPTGQDTTQGEARYRTAGILADELLGMTLLPVTNAIREQQIELAHAIWAVFQINDLSVGAGSYVINGAYSRNALTLGLPSVGGLATSVDVQARIAAAYTNRNTFDLSRLEIYTPVPYSAPVGNVVSQELLRVRVPEGQVFASLLLNLGGLGLLGFAFRRRMK